MAIIYGRELFGHVEHVPGHFLVATECVHVWYVPLIPVQSWIITDLRADGSWRGTKIPWHGRSLFLGFMRSLCVLIAVGLLGFGALRLFEALTVMPGRRPPLAAWLGPLVGSFVAYVGYRITWRLGRPSADRARTIAALLDLPQPRVESEVVPALDRITPVARSLALRALVVGVGLCALSAGLLARFGRISLGTAFTPVTVAEAPAHADSFAGGYLDIAAALDPAGTVYATGLEEPPLGLHRPGTTEFVDARTDDLRLTGLIGAHVEVRGRLDSGWLTFTNRSIHDRPITLRLAPLAGSGRRIWAVSRWFQTDNGEREIVEWMNQGDFTGGLIRLDRLEANLNRGPSIQAIQAAALAANLALPPEDAVVVRTGGYYQDEATLDREPLQYAYVPVKSAPEPLYVEIEPELAAGLTSPVRGHLTRDTRVQRGLTGMGRDAGRHGGTLVLDAHWTRYLEDCTEFRTQVAQNGGASLFVIGLLWPLLP